MKKQFRCGLITLFVITNDFDESCERINQVAERVSATRHVHILSININDGDEIHHLMARSEIVRLARLI